MSAFDFALLRVRSFASGRTTRGVQPAIRCGIFEAFETIGHRGQRRPLQQLHADLVRPQPRLIQRSDPSRGRKARHAATSLSSENACCEWVMIMTKAARLK
jgi:hypothetical protein